MGDLPPYPYPGLRPFRLEEADVFFGREQQVSQLLEKLHHDHFVALVGTSGCGKSSLLSAGLVPALETGFMPDAGARWRVASMRPGTDPMRRLAEALVGILPTPDDLKGSDAYASLYATLDRGPLGLTDALSECPLPERTNLLIIVDQFEEIFRYRQEGKADEANAFVALLLATAEQAIPVYVVIAMRSERLGDCAVFSGLPEAINQSLFLTPRLTREQRHAAIVGPAHVFSGDVEPSLVNRLLNDMGADPDQLPLMQHALMRTWGRATGATGPEGGEVVDTRFDHDPADGKRASVTLALRDYERVGGLAKALSNHADRAFEELDASHRRVAEIMFRCLTNEGTGQRDTRRPVSVGHVAEVAGGVSEVTAVNEVVAAFRRPGREFLSVSPGRSDRASEQPSSGGPSVGRLAPDTMLDISHESLIRRWERLSGWVSHEAKVAEDYRQLLSRARRWKKKDAALLGFPDLDVALDWTNTEKLNAAWASRYGGDFELAMEFLRESAAARRAAKEAAEREIETRRQQEETARLHELAQAQEVAGEQRRAAKAESLRADAEQRSAAKLRQWAWILGGLLVVTAVALAYSGYSSMSWIKARQEAKQHLRTAISHKLAARALRLATDQRDLALLLSVASYEADHTPEARSSLLELMAWNRRVERFLHGSAPVGSVVFIEDGRRVVAVSQDGKAWSSWDLVTGKTTTVPVPGSEGGRPTFGVALAGDGKRLALGTDDGAVRLLDAAPDGVELNVELNVSQAQVLSVALSRDGRRLAAGDRDGSVVVWNLGDGRSGPQREFASKHQGAVASLAFSPDGTKLVSGSADSTIRVWDMKTGRSLDLRGHAGPVVSVSFAPDGERLASGSADKTVRIWDSRTGLSLRLLTGHYGPVRSVAFAPDGRRLASGSADKTVRVWDAEKDDPLLELRGHRDIVQSVTFSPGGVLASGGADHKIILWHTTADPVLGVAGLLGVEDALSADGRKLAISRGKEVWVWDLATRESVGPLKGQDEWVSSLAFTADGTTLAAGGKDGTIRLWNAETGQVRGVNLKDDSWVGRLAFTADARRLASASGSGNAQASGAGWKIRLWDLSTGKIVRDFGGQNDVVVSLAFSPDGRMLGAGSMKNVVLWDLQAAPGAEPRILLEHSGSVIIGSVISAAFSPDSQKLVTGSADRTVRIWDVFTGKRLGSPLKGHNGPVSSVTFVDAKTLASSEETLASGEGGGGILLWDVDTGQLLGAPLGAGSRGVRTLIARASDGALVSASRDYTTGAVTLSKWKVHPELLKAWACATANRSLEDLEWKQHVGEGQKFPVCPDAQTGSRITPARPAPG